MKRQCNIMKKMFCIILVAFMMCSGLSVGLISYASAEKVYFIPDTYYSSSADDIVTTALEISFEEYLRNELIKCAERIDISSYNIPVDNVWELSSFIYDNSPELFHISGMGVSYVGNTLTAISPQYEYTPEVFAEMYNDCLESVDRLLSGIRDNNKLSDVEKALLIHDRIALLCEYDSENLQNNTLPHESYTIYGVLVNGVAVCQGYAEAYLYLLDKVGIESYICESDSLCHAWNIVIIDGEEYHVDVTWDDPTNDISGRVLHTNFLRSSEGIYETGHTAADYITAPDCDKYDGYFWQASSSAFQLVGDEIYYIDGTDSYIKKYSDNSAIKSVSDMWMSGPYSYYPGCYSRLGTDGKHLFYNSSQSVFELDPLTGETVSIWTPETENEYFRIYGFKYQEGYLYCDIYSSPNFTLTTKEEYQQKKHYISDSLAPLGISIKTLPDKISFDLNEAFSYEGLSVSLNYPNGTSLVLTDGFTVSEGDTSTEGKKTVTVAYRGFSAEYEINVSCLHKNISVIPAEQSTCIVNGHEAYTKCLVCNKIISGSDEPLPLIEHKYQPEITLKATCTEEGEKTFTCTVCSCFYKEKINATGHSYKAEIISPPSCVTEGVRLFQCECGDFYCEDIPLLEHRDSDYDGFCDECIKGLAPEEPACPHMCHRDGFAGFLWKIINFFSSKFGINALCECGEAHY